MLLLLVLLYRQTDEISKFRYTVLGSGSATFIRFDPKHLNYFTPLLSRRVCNMNYHAPRIPRKIDCKDGIRKSYSKSWRKRQTRCEGKQCDSSLHRYVFQSTQIEHHFCRQKVTFIEWCLMTSSPLQLRVNKPLYSLRLSCCLAICRLWKEWRPKSAILEYKRFWTEAFHFQNWTRTSYQGMGRRCRRNGSWRDSQGTTYSLPFSAAWSALAIDIFATFLMLPDFTYNPSWIIYYIIQITCTPDYAYGAGGFASWGILPNSTLIFEIEVLSI